MIENFTEIPEERTDGDAETRSPQSEHNHPFQHRMSSFDLMVVFPLLIVAATVGYTLVDPKGNSLVPFSYTSSSSSFSNAQKSPWVFCCYGVVFGMGLSSALSYEARRRRIWDRVRLTLSGWLRKSSLSVLEKYRTPTPSDSVEGTFMIDLSSLGEDNIDGSSNASCGVRRQVVSPDWCFTSTMTVTLLTLYAGSELVSQPSVGVEFYYVLKGEGICMKGEGENIETMKLTTDTCLVVDPFSIRGFKATGTEDLTLLRASDSSTQSPVHGQDAARRILGSISTSVELLNAGIHKIEALVSRYARNPREDRR